VDKIKAEIQLKIDRGIAQRCIDRHHDALVDIMEQSKASGVEVGARFFRGKDGECTIGETCIGAECKLPLYDPVHRNMDRTQDIGSFHTHPSGAMGMSISDMAIFSLAKLIFACVGAPETGFMQCYLMPHGTEESDMVVSKRNQMFDHFQASYEIAVDVAREMIDAGLIKEDDLPRGLPFAHALPILRHFARGTEFEQRLPVVDPYGDALLDLIEYLKQNREKIFVPIGPPVRLI